MANLRKVKYVVRGGVMRPIAELAGFGEVTLTPVPSPTRTPDPWERGAASHDPHSHTRSIIFPFPGRGEGPRAAAPLLLC